VGTDDVTAAEADGLVAVSQGIFGDDGVFTFAEQESNGGLVVGVLKLGIHGAEVEAQFAGMLRLEGAGLEFNHHVAAQF
jgi:hypothetical protein